MANEILVKTGTPICWSATDYSSTGSGITRTHDLDLDSLADTKARQGVKASLGATRSAQYAVLAGVELSAAPTAGEVIEYYWSASYSSGAGVGNAGGASGTDAAYKDGEEAEWVKQLEFLGCLTVTADSTGVVQRQVIGRFCPPTRYGMPVVKTIHWEVWQICLWVELHHKVNHIHPNFNQELHHKVHHDHKVHQHKDHRDHKDHHNAKTIFHRLHQ